MVSRIAVRCMFVGTLLCLFAVWSSAGGVGNVAAKVRELRAALEGKTEVDPQIFGGAARYTFHQQKLDELVAALTPESVASLLQGSELDSLDKHLLEIAAAYASKSQAFSDADSYRERIRERESVAPMSTMPLREHLTPPYRLAWEWVLLMPKQYPRAMQETAAIALAEISDPRSIEIMELAHRQAVLLGVEVATGFPMVRSLGSFKKQFHAQALEAAGRMWCYAKSVAGKKVGTGVIDPGLPGQVLQSLSFSFQADSVNSELKRARRGSPHAVFLAQVKAIQDKRKAENDEWRRKMIESGTIKPDGK